MRWHYVAAGLLWAVLLALIAGALATLAKPEPLIPLLLIAALTVPIILQLRSTHRHLREMTANRIELGGDGLQVRLSGQAREWKGLPDVPQVAIPWSDVLSIVSEKKRFVYPSAIPLGYPLVVFTVYTKTGGISFTRECVPNAQKVAAAIAARLGATS